MAYHSSGVDGFLTQTLVLPEQRIGVLVSANTHASALPLPAVLTLAERLLGEPDGDWLARLRPTDDEDPPELPRMATTALAGRWGRCAAGAAGYGHPAGPVHPVVVLLDSRGAAGWCGWTW